ncbi:hypothetical protein [Vulgatibacter incomptus]|uniref:Flagellar basal-body rod modification protein FlgD n=1 Tax=Vulgatibacter incomptus TaxID=1391653 RepID=A0A0K1PHX5_9BACT|nr:hypothetical protein [Vulgatibacter incomptus]AKU93143.1 Flagellar basal-body rod modification protein FlgD [Vulgatibacter incomptus]
MFRMKYLLVAALFAVGTMTSACGSDSADTGGTGGDNGTAGSGGDDGTAGSGGDDGTAGSGGDDGTAGSGGDDGTGGTGGDDGTGGTGGDDGGVKPTDCEAACDFAEETCGWLDASSPDYAAEHAGCIAMCDAETECFVEAIHACSERALDACFRSADETPECTEMCDNLYYECGSGFEGVSRADCGAACSAGVFEPELVACLSATCDEDALQACFDDGEGPGGPDACEVACAHVTGECGLDTWTETSCLRACRASYTAEQADCLASLECTADPIETCFGELSCVGMCDHVYNECGAAIGDGTQEDCEVLCRWGLFSDTEVACFSTVACGEVDACDETLAD